MDVFIFMLCMIVIVNFPRRVFRPNRSRSNPPDLNPLEKFSLEKSHQFSYHPDYSLYINCFVNEDRERKYYLTHYRKEPYQSQLTNEDMKSISIEFRKILNAIKNEEYKNNLFYELLYIPYHTSGGDLPPRKIRFFDKYELMPTGENSNAEKTDPLFTIFVRRSRKRYYITASFRFSLDSYYGGDMELTELTWLLRGFLHVFGDDFAED